MPPATYDDCDENTPLLTKSLTFPIAPEPRSSRKRQNAKTVTANDLLSSEQFRCTHRLKHAAAQPGNSSEYKKRARYTRLSKPTELMRNDYDVIVIGSGYGGAVAASRMARGRQSVAVLELGRERWPGEYPETFDQARHQLHISGDLASHDIAYGDPTDLYNLHLGKGQNVFTAHGLGGTSLLNANVFLEADRKTLQLSAWPKDIRENPDCLKPYYQRARDMLQPQVYPESNPPLKKLSVLETQAEILGLKDKFRRVEQTTWFEPDGRNSSGVKMHKSTLTGMDSTGVNDGSKSSTLMNYIADAWNWGAEIFTQCEVRHIEKDPEGDGYLVFFAWHRAGRMEFTKTFYSDLMWVRAKKMVFLGAGALGSTEILLRSKELGKLNISNTVGESMSGNGDLLAFGYNLNTAVDSVARPDPKADMPIGPTIAGIIDCRDADEAFDGFVIEEGAIPQALAKYMQIMLELLPGRRKPPNITFKGKWSKIKASAVTRFGGPYAPNGSLERTQVYLIMCHDQNEAILTLDNNKPNLEFLGIAGQKHIGDMNSLLEKATLKLNGTYVNNPFYAINGYEITVHPIGGASMSQDNTGKNGVTNSYGQVFVGDKKEVYKGLAVTDASIIPRALGANPFATITALAERSVEHMAKQFHIDIDYTTNNGELDFDRPPEYPILRRAKSANVDDKKEEFVKMAIRTYKEGFEFTEIMKGHIHKGDEIKDFEIATREAKNLCQGEARFFLSVHAYDMDTLISSSEHGAMLTGTFECGNLPGSPYMVRGGDLKFFVDDPRSPDTKNLMYDFDMEGIDGKKIHFNGYKVIDDSAAFNVSAMWRATTTLRVTLTEIPTNGEEEGGKVIGRGILRIKPDDFKNELKSFYAKINVKYDFVKYWIQNLTQSFFAPLFFLKWPKSSVETFSPKNEPSFYCSVRAKDGIRSKMMAWDPLFWQPQHLELLFIGGVAVDEKVFALTTVQQNVINYFREKGYRCWCVVHRVGLCENAKLGYTTYDARLDVAAAIDKIDALRQSEKIGRLASKTYVIAHCAGSMALAAGLLTGDVKTDTIAGITASQVFMTPQFAKTNRIKARIPDSTQIYSALSRSNWYDCNITKRDNLFQKVFTSALNFYPVGAKDTCKSIACHRSSFIFGLLWSHENLNNDTHAKVHKLLGGTTMKNQRHLIKMGRMGKILDSEGRDNIVNSRNMERLKGIPILFLQGKQNRVYEPANINTTLNLLETELNLEDYELKTFDKYGHFDVWMGKNANRVVYREVDNHLERVVDRMKQNGVNGFAIPPQVGRHRAPSRSSTLPAKQAEIMVA